MINVEKAYDKFTHLLQQIDASDKISLAEQKELRDEMKSDIEEQLQQVYRYQRQY